MTDWEDDIEELAGAEGTEDIVERLATLPPETEREWELVLTRLVEVAPDREADLQRIFERDEEYDDGVRFAAFFAYCTYLRRRGNVTELGRTLDAHEAAFGERGMYPHLRSLHAKQLRTPRSYADSVRYAEEALDRMRGEQPGVIHSYVTAIVRVLENDRGDALDRDREELLDEAARQLGRILDGDGDPYPKFKVTEGRIAALRGDYDEALRAINEGIDLEDDSKDDYALRVTNFRAHESRVYLNKYVDEIERRQESLREQQKRGENLVQDLQGQTLQFLGFFATLLAVIIATVNIASGFELVEAASLIVVLVGGLLVAFGGLTVMLPIEDELKKGAALFTMGMVTVGLGLAVIAAVTGIV